MIGSFPRASKQMGLMRDYKILWLKGGDKVTRWVSRKRENGFGSSVLTFAKEQEDVIGERFVKSRGRKERSGKRASDKEKNDMTRWVSRQKDGIWVWVFSAGLCFGT
jgi:hypothetical protein